MYGWKEEIEGQGFGIECLYEARNTEIHARYADYGHLNVVKALVRANADIREVDEDGLTCLHEACGQGKVKVVRFLMYAGCDRPADVYLPNNGPSLRDLAMAGGFYDIAGTVLEVFRELGV